MTPFEKITGTATSVVFVAGVLAAVLISGASGVTISAQGDGPAGPSEAHLVGSGDESTATTRGRSTSSVSRDGRTNHGGTGADGVKAGEAVPQHRSTTTTLPDDALGLLDQLVGLIPEADLRALTDLLEALDPALLDDVLDQLEAALGTGNLQALVDELLDTSSSTGTDDATGSLEDPVGTVEDIVEDGTETLDGTVDDVVDDTTGTVDGVVDDVVDDTTGTVDDTTGTVDDAVGSITGSGDTTGTVEDTTETVTDTVTDTVGGLL